MAGDLIASCGTEKNWLKEWISANMNREKFSEAYDNIKEKMEMVSADPQMVVTGIMMTSTVCTVSTM